jgi:hypothetical protein
MKPIEAAVRRALLKLVTAFGQKIEDTDETVAVYLETLLDLDPLDVDGGAQRAIRSERFFPRPSILRAFALEERTARTVTIRPLVHATDTLCSLCGSTKRWLRTVQQPEPDLKYWTERAIARGEATPRSYQRDEVLHEYDCPLRRPDQAGATLAAVA